MVPCHQLLLEYLCEPIKESGIEKASFFCVFSASKELIEGVSGTKMASGYVLSCAMLVGQGLEHFSYGHWKGKLHFFVVRINSRFVKMYL